MKNAHSFLSLLLAARLNWWCGFFSVSCHCLQSFLPSRWHESANVDAGTFLIFSEVSMKGFQTPRIQSPSSNAPSHSLLTEALRSGVVRQATRNKARVCKHPDSDNHTVMAVSLAATVGCCRLPDASQFLQQTQRYLMCVSETLKCGNILMCSACLSIL